MDLDEIKRDIDLRQYAKDRYEICCNSRGYAPCPFHEEKEPSFEIKKFKGIWGFRDWHLYKDDHDFSGTIIDFVMRMDKKTKEETCTELLKEFNPARPNMKRTTKKLAGGKSSKWIEPEIERTHIYKDSNGGPVHQKVKYKKNPGDEKWAIKHWAGNAWEFGRGDHELIPYNLDKFKDYESVVICEGEKDADTVSALDLGLLATSAPAGKGSWPDSLTKYFGHFKRATLFYDVGNDEDVKKHAEKLQATFPGMEIYIANVPLEEKEADITDYLEQRQDLKLKRIDFLDILDKKKRLRPKDIQGDQTKGIFIGNLEEFIVEEIPEEEKLVDPIVFRGGLTEIGGVKGSHKSFFVNLLAFHFSSGKSPFLKFEVEKPGKILLIQQEVSLGFMQERLKKMRTSMLFNTEGRFFPVTTTANQLKLLIDKDFDQIKKLLDKFEPDILCLDPLSSFNTAEENMSKDMSKIVSRLSELKSKYNIGLIFTHHFSSKVNPNDPNAPSEAGGWFRGHTTLTDAADVLVCLHRLPGQRENPNLPKPYEDYNLIQVELRNGQWPEKFAIEFDGATFLLKESDIWQEIGKKILPGQIEDLIEANDGEMLQKDVIAYFSSMARPTTVKRAITQAYKQELIDKVSLTSKGNPVLLKIKK